MMQAKIALITVLTDDTPLMLRFYRDVLGFQPQGEVDEANPGYVEFAHEGVRFSLCSRSIMQQATGDPSFDVPRGGQALELAFPCDSYDDVDATYAALVAQGATPVKGPSLMPWGQRTAFFADPEGNIHEIFADPPA
ncbi:VOC family protein [Aggregatilinea lenta]|uniref:VOC family protein n=1 Tax=Aggregatilinea lenta TaxID=913108 RepID=UPI000E5AC265|nr:VOC family protein [Aggregatilinea lenta]